MYSGSNLFSEEEIVCLLAERAGKPFVFLESAASDPLSSNSFLFYDFQDILTYRGRGDLDLFFQRIENALAKGFWLCGYFSYEFGHYLENSLVTKKIPKGSFPLAWLGVSAKPAAIIPKDRKKLNYKEQDGLSYKIYDLKPNIT
ncbi:MAG TPA: hypothetical protein ENN78_01085, partial [Candidatus Omnitrophica bacterium]|nr:hypothetical protein [Candidatus Omnitrophota bacterium]